MRRTPHLLLGISGHGFGHLAQCAPVVNALARKLPDLRLTVLSILPEHELRRHIVAEFARVGAEMEPVLRMRSAWEVDVPASCAAFRDFHRQVPDRLAGLRAQLRRLQPDLVLADIPWLLLTAAAQEGIAAAALCSLNWAAVFECYCGDRADARVLAQAMWAGYRAAEVFLCPAPSMPMPQLANTRAIGPVARAGTPDQARLRAQLDLPSGVRLVLVALGGIPSALPLAAWPRVDDTLWLFPQRVASARTDLAGCGHLDMHFIDLLASCDAVLTKPGYGTVTEAVCNAVPILTLARPDWPETAGMLAWAREHGVLQEISARQFAAGDFGDVLAALLAMPGKTPPLPLGVHQAADDLEYRLARVQA